MPDPTPRGIVIRRKTQKPWQAEHNDNFARAWELSAGEGEVRTTLPWEVAGNTTEPGEPIPQAQADAVGAPNFTDNDIHNTVWFRLRVGAGTVFMSTGDSQNEILGDDFDQPYSRAYNTYSSYGATLLNLFIGVYTGEDLGSLTEVISSTHTTGPWGVPEGDPRQGGFSFQVSEETLLWIQVGACKPGMNGAAMLWYKAVPPPDNDNPDPPGGGDGGPLDLGSDPDGDAPEWSSCVYLTNPEEPSSACGPAYKSAWFTWTAPATDTFVFAASSDGGDVVLSVWDEDGTTEIGCDSGTNAGVSFSATEGTTYLIGCGMVESFECGNMSLSWSQGAAATDYYVYFTMEMDATAASFTTNGGVSFPPGFAEVRSTADFFGQYIFPIRHRIAGVDQDYYTWGVGYTDNFPDGFRFGPQINPAQTYTVEFHQHRGGPGVGYVEAWIDGTQYGPWDAEDSWLGPFDALHFGAVEGVINRYEGQWKLDDFRVGSSGRGTTDIFSADFASAIVPPFDSLTDPASETTLTGGLWQIDFPGGTSSDDCYAEVAI